MIAFGRSRALPLVFALLVAASGARADDVHAHAAELRKNGDLHMVAKRYPEALAAYDASYALEADPALQYNRGRALQFLARYPEALDAIEKFASQAPRELLDRVPALPDLLADLRGRVATVTVKSTVLGAHVLVNDRSVGTTPIDAPLKVNAGHVTIDALADGYFPFHREVDLRGGARNEITLTLLSRESFAILTVKSRVAGASISLDARAAGVAPVELGAAAGGHRVGASKDGHDDVFTQVVLESGERKEVWLDPQPRPPIYAKWWFWTIAGVAVAAGVATVVLVTTDKSPKGGDYSPGVVRF